MKLIGCHKLTFIILINFIFLIVNCHATIPKIKTKKFEKFIIETDKPGIISHRGGVITSLCDNKPTGENCFNAAVVSESKEKIDNAENEYCKLVDKKKCAEKDIIKTKIDEGVNKGQTNIALKYYKKSCDLNYALGCYEYSFLLVKSKCKKLKDNCIENVLSKKEIRLKILKYFSKACLLNILKACEFKKEFSKDYNGNKY